MEITRCYHFILLGKDWSISSFEGIFFALNDLRDSSIHNCGTVVRFINNFQLKQNYPNPFNPSTTIEYEIKQSGRIQLEIYNTLGQLIRKLVDEEKLAGKYSVIWDGKDDYNELVTSGTYFYRIRSGDLVSDKKMLLLR